MEQEQRKCPDTENGVKRIKAYETLAMFSMILGIIFLITKEHELSQDFIISSLILDNIAIRRKIS